MGRKAVESELASLERRFVQHAQRVDRSLNGVGRTSANTGSRSPRVGRDPVFGPGQREFAASVRAREKAELQSARNISREKLQQERQLSRAKESLDRQRSRSLYQQHQQEARDALEARARRAVFVRSTLGNAASNVAGVVRSVGKAGVTAVGLTGVGLAAASISQGMKLDEQSRRLAIGARGPGERGADPEQLRKQFTQTGIETGIAPEDLAAGAQSYVAKTGDLPAAMANLRTFALTAQATGASVSDIASAAADLSQKFDIKSVEDMGNALAVLTFQGKRGAFELKDIAEQFPEMAAAAQRAGMSGVKGMQTLGGLAQIARQSTGSGAEASTAVQMMLTQLTTKAADLHSGKALGGRTVDVFEGGNPENKARDIPTVLAEVISKSHGNQTELAKLFDVRGIRAVSPFIKTYRDAAKAAGPKATDAQREEAGRVAVLKQIQDASATGGTFKDLKVDAADAMKSASVQWEVVMMRLKAAMSESLLPAVERLVPELSQLVPVVADTTRSIVRLAEWLSKNLFTGLGLLVGGALVTEIAKAGISAAISRAIAASVAGSAVPGLGAGAGIGSLKGGLATGAAAIGVGLAVDQAASFANENGGWGSVGAFLGIGTDNWGADGVLEYMSKDARERAGWKPQWAEETKRLQDEAFAKPVPGVPGAAGAAAEFAAPKLDTDPVNAQLSETAKGLAAFRAALAVGFEKPNRGDKPTGIKP